MSETDTNGSPSQNGENGKDDRDRKGRFKKGNPGGPGNPRAKQTADIREALLAAVTPEAAAAIAAQLVKKAKTGNLPAIKELLDRVLGKSVAKIEAEVGPLQPNMPLPTTDAMLADFTAMYGIENEATTYNGEPNGLPNSN